MQIKGAELIAEETSSIQLQHHWKNMRTATRACASGLFGHDAAAQLKL